MQAPLGFLSSDCGTIRNAARSSADLRGEIPLLLGEVCLARPDLLASVGRNPQSSRRLTEMMRRVGIEGLPREEAPSLLGDLQFRCADCAAVPRCKSWMATGQGSDFHSFCPNAARFDALWDRLRGGAAAANDSAPGRANDLGEILGMARLIGIALIPCAGILVAFAEWLRYLLGP